MNQLIAINAELLIVDGHPGDYQHLETEANSQVARFSYATSGDEALQLPRITNQVLWFINFDLPDMSGVELLKVLREREPHLRGALVSDHYSEQQERIARQQGATLYVCKPPQMAWLTAFASFHKLETRDHQAHGPPHPTMKTPFVSNQSDQSNQSNQGKTHEHLF